MMYYHTVNLDSDKLDKIDGELWLTEVKQKHFRLTLLHRRSEIKPEFRVFGIRKQLM